MTEATDRALLERWVSERDAESYAELAKRYSGMVYATCRRVLGNDTAAEDVAQECFEVLSQSGARAGDFLGPWLHRVATTRSLNRVKADQRRKRREERYAAEQPAVVELAWDDLYHYVDEAIDQLPEHLRLPILAHFFQGQTHDAIAASLRTSRPTITYRIRKGIERIRKHLARRGIPVAAPALAGLLATNLAEAATPPLGLAAALSKLALAGPIGGATSSLATGVGAANVIAGVFIMKKALVALVVLAALVAGSLVVRRSSETAPPTNDNAPLAPPKPVDPKAASLEASEAEGAPPETPRPVSLTSLSTESTGQSAAADTPLPAVSGTVRTVDGTPVGEARVQALRKRGSGLYSVLNGARSVAAEARTAQDGSFSLGPLPPGEMLLAHVTHPDWSVGGVGIDPLNSGERRNGVDIVLYPPTSLSGFVADEGGRGIPDASVFIQTALHPDLLDFARLDEKARAGKSRPPVIGAGFYGGASQVTTGDDGRFEFTNIPDGWLVSQLGAWKTGYAPNYVFDAESAAKRRAEVERYGKSAWFPTTLALPCEAVTIVLERAGVITGQVVVEANGKPAVDALVTLGGTVVGEVPSGQVPYNLCARTDAKGRYAFNGVASGALHVQAEKDGLVSRIVGMTLAAGGEKQEVNLSLSAAGAIEGVVYNAATGNPIHDVRLTYLNQDAGVFLMSEASDHQGRYGIPGLAAGNWLVWPVSAWQLSKEYHPGRREMTVHVAFGQTTNGIDLYCEKSGSHSGSITGKVTSELGRLVAGVEVRVHGRDEMTRSGNDGGYRLDGVEAGTHELVAFDPSNEKSGMARVDVVEHEEVEADIRLIGGTARLGGRITDRQGKAVAEPMRVHIGELPNWRHIQTLFPDNDGYYRSSPLVPGRYRVNLEFVKQALRVSPSNQEINLKEGEDAADLDFVVSRMEGFLSGMVVYADHSPAEFCRVEAGDDQVTVRGTTNAQGAFRLEPLDGEDLHLRVRPPGDGFEVWAVLVGLKAGTSDIRVVVEPPGKVVGRILAPTKSKVVVHARRGGADSIATSTAFPISGALELDLQPGEYSVQVWVDDRQQVIEPVIVDSGQVTDLGEIDLSGGTGTIVGTVTNAGEPIDDEGVQFELLALPTADFGPDRHTNVIAGRYAVRNLNPGMYRVLLKVMDAKGGHVFVQEAEVADHAETQVDFDISAGNATVLGTVIPPIAPGSGLVVACEPGTCPLAEGVTFSESLRALFTAASGADIKPDGTFRLEGLTPGTYDIVAAIMNDDMCTALRIQTVALSDGEQASLDFDLTR